MNRNNTSDLIHLVAESAQFALVSLAIIIAAIWLIGPGACKLLRAAVVDPAIAQWNSAGSQPHVRLVPAKNGFFKTVDAK